MPIYRRPYEKGRLIIEFKVNFPENGFLSPDKLSLLEKLLPERKEAEETDEMDQVELVDFDANQDRQRHYNGEADEADEHHPRGFLEEISRLSHSIVFLYFFALIAEEGFLISPCYFLELCIQMLISFLF